MVVERCVNKAVDQCRNMVVGGSETKPWYWSDAMVMERGHGMHEWQ